MGDERAVRWGGHIRDMNINFCLCDIMQIWSWQPTADIYFSASNQKKKNKKKLNSFICLFILPNNPRVCVAPFCWLFGDFYDISKGRRQHDEDNIKVLTASLQKELEAINNLKNSTRRHKTRCTYSPERIQILLLHMNLIRLLVW